MKFREFVEARLHEEQIDELSKRTLGSYVTKARSSHHGLHQDLGYHHGSYDDTSIDSNSHASEVLHSSEDEKHPHMSMSQAYDHQINKRAKGIERSLYKAAGNDLTKRAHVAGFMRAHANHMHHAIRAAAHEASAENQYYDPQARRHDREMARQHKQMASMHKREADAHLKAIDSKFKTSAK